MKKDYLECGKICSAHGVKGAIKVESWCDTTKVLASRKRVFMKKSDAPYVEYKVLSASPNDRFVLMSLEGINTREEAQAYKNTVLYLERADIPVPRGRVLISDIIGLPVIDADNGRVYGTLKEVNDAVKGKLYVVSTDSSEVLIPGVPEFIKEIDTERGVFIHTIPGFFD